VRADRAGVEQGATESEPFPNAHTSFGLTVAKALGDFLVLDAVYQTGARGRVTDEDLLAAQVELAGAEGTFHLPGRRGMLRRGPAAASGRLAERL